MTKYFVTPHGEYIGGFDGAEPPGNSIEVPSAPSDARQIWTGNNWASVKTTFSEALSIANAEYQKDVDSLNRAFSLAIMFDGASEEAKKATIRTQYAARKEKYATDLAALRAQYEA